MDSQTAYHYLVEIYDDHLIYEVVPGQAGAMNDQFIGFFKATYQVADDGTVTFGNPEKVIKETRFIETNDSKKSDRNQAVSSDTEKQTNKSNKKGEQKMGKDCLVNSLIQCKRTQWTEDDRERLLQFNEEDLEKMAPTDEEKPDDATGASPDLPEGEGEAAPEGDDGGENQANNAEAFLKSVPDDIRDVFESGMKLHNAQRQELIQKILNADGNQWTQDDLETMKLEQLQKMSSLVKDAGPVYLGMAGGQVDNAEDNEPLKIPSLEDFLQH
jgi:hypothetical protein